MKNCYTCTSARYIAPEPGDPAAGEPADGGYFKCAVTGNLIAEGTLSPDERCKGHVISEGDQEFFDNPPSDDLYDRAPDYVDAFIEAGVTRQGVCLSV